MSETTTKPKNSKTIIAAIIVGVAIIAAILIYIFQDDVKSGVRREPRTQPAPYIEATTYEQPEHNPIFGEPLPGGGIIVTPATTDATAPITQPPATNPPAPQPARPPVTAPSSGAINVVTAFPGATVKETWADNQWILTAPAGWSVIIPGGWIANTDPNRWTINPKPAGYSGASGEVLPAGTSMQATLAGDIYVRYVG